MPPYQPFLASDIQNKVNNNVTDSSILQSQTLRRQLANTSNTRLYNTPTTSTMTTNLDEQNNITGDPDKNYPDLLEINSFNKKGDDNKEFPFFTLPRKSHDPLRNNNNNNNRHQRDSDSQSPLLPGSRYGSSGGESSIGSNSNRRLSIESYSHFPTANGNHKPGQRSNSFLNLASATVVRGAPSLPASPASATPLLQLRGLPRAELTRAPVATPAPSMPLTYDYHAAQLERFLEEYRSLQEQLCKMKETCDNMSSTREKSRFIDPLLFSNCVATSSTADDANPTRSILKNRPSVAVTATSGTAGSGSSIGTEASGQDGGSMSPWTSSGTLLKRLGGAGDFFRS